MIPTPKDAAETFFDAIVEAEFPTEVLAKLIRERDRAILAVAESLWENPLPYLTTLRSKVLGE